MTGTCHITAIHLEHPPGHRYSHIAEVKLLGGSTETKDRVIGYIRSGWKYYTYPPGGSPQARVLAVSCPRCAAGDYITTAADSTEKNNLLDLPRY